MSKRGPKSTYSDATAEKICARLAEGEPLRQICRDEGMPAWQTVYDWIRANEEFAGRIARARELGYDAIAEEAMEISDDSRNDWVEAHDKDGEAIGYKLNGDHVQRSKLRIETRLKLLAKWSPKKYGEKTSVEHSGGTTLQIVSEFDD